MNLAIDIGNTTVKMALFEGEELKEIFSGSGQLEAILTSHPISHGIISKTGGDHKVEALLLQKKIPLLHLSAKLKLPLEVLYQTSETLGSDRIAGSVMAKHLFPARTVLKIDFGTCITYDVVNEKNQYLGGSISPGMNMRFKALNHYTEKLPLINPEGLSSAELIGADTRTSILSGVIQGIVQEVGGIINEYRLRYKDLQVVSTGGDMALFVPLLKSDIFTRPYLVLEGMNRILNYNL